MLLIPVSFRLTCNRFVKDPRNDISSIIFPDRFKLRSFANPASALITVIRLSLKSRVVNLIIFPKTDMSTISLERRSKWVKFVNRLRGDRSPIRFFHRVSLVRFVIFASGERSDMLLSAKDSVRRFVAYSSPVRFNAY